MTVAEEEMPESPLRRRVLAAFCTLIYLHYGLLWVAAAASIAKVIGRRALGGVEGSPVLSAASSVALYSITSALLLFPVAMALVLRSESDDIHAENDTLKEPLIIPSRVPRKILKDPFMIGTLVSAPFFMLIVAGLLLDLLVAQSPVKGSRMEQIGSVLKDVGVLGAGAGYCFVILPTLVLRVEDELEGSCDCSVET